MLLPNVAAIFAAADEYHELSDCLPDNAPVSKFEDLAHASRDRIRSPLYSYGEIQSNIH